MKTTSFSSPKNKFRAELIYSKALSEIGSRSSVTANDIEDLKGRVQVYVAQAKRNKATTLVVIYENKSIYPSFDWKEIDRYENN